YGRRTVAMPADVLERCKIERLRDRVIAELGQVDILVTAAEAILKKPALEVTDGEWDAILNVNATATLRACQTFFEPLAARRQGRLINIVALTSFLSLK